MKKALLDTSFFLRLLDSSDVLHFNARQHFEYLIQKNCELYISTIAIAEFCVRNPVEHLPLRNLRILPFNFFEAVEAGKLYKIVRDIKETRGSERLKREVVQNDCKQFGQAIYFKFDYFISADSEAIKIYNLFKENVSHRFEFIDIHNEYTDSFGILL